MDKYMKLMAQLALLFVVVWIVASAAGKGSQAVPGGRRSMNRCGGKYRGQYSRYGSRRTLAKYFNAGIAQGAAASPVNTTVL